jgi:hypothetical protein
MEKITITNLKDGRVWTAKFPTSELADAWIAQQVKKEGRLPIRMQSDQGDHDPADVIATQEISGITFITLKAQADVDRAEDTEHLIAARINIGTSIRQCCNDVFDMLIGYNIERQLTVAQINQMQANFASALVALQTYRVTVAKTAIEAVVPDGELVTLQMKEDILGIFTKYGV